MNKAKKSAIHEKFADMKHNDNNIPILQSKSGKTAKILLVILVSF